MVPLSYTNAFIMWFCGFFEVAECVFDGGPRQEGREVGNDGSGGTFCFLLWCTEVCFYLGVRGDQGCVDIVLYEGVECLFVVVLLCIMVCYSDCAVGEELSVDCGPVGAVLEWGGLLGWVCWRVCLRFSEECGGLLCGSAL